MLRIVQFYVMLNVDHQQYLGGHLKAVNRPNYIQLTLQLWVFFVMC